MSTQTSFKKTQILGTDVDIVTIDEAAKFLIEYVKDSKNPPAYMVKQYVELLQRGYEEEAISQLLNHSLLGVPEGVSTQWASAYLSGRRSWWRALWLAAAIVLHPTAIRRPITEKFGGTVFTWRLFELCAQHNVSVYLIGSPRDSDINRTIAFIHDRLPDLAIVGSWPGKLSGLSGQKLQRALIDNPVEQELVANLKQTKPDLVLVGMGFPLQEELSVKLVSQLKHGVFIGEGGTFDYDNFGGIRRKAPKAIQSIGLEWLWRLALEPSRIKRQLAIPKFMWTVYRQPDQSAKTVSSKR